VKKSLESRHECTYQVHMRLQDYLADTGVTRAEFARRIGVKHITVTRYVSEGRVPEPSVMEKIIEATEGKVTANDFFDIAA
jgi:transcriptional regulator with XRE-family HTH domain